MLERIGRGVRVPWRRSPLVSALLALGAVGAATLAFLPGRDVFAKGQWGLAYLLVTAGVAYVTDAYGAVTAAILSFLAWDFFFLPPYGYLHLDDPKDSFTLVVFLAIAIILGLRTAALRDSEWSARERECEARALGDLASALISAGSFARMAEVVLASADELLHPSEAALIGVTDVGVETFWLRGEPEVRAEVTEAAEALMSGGPVGPTAGELRLLEVGGVPLGGLYIGAPAATGDRGAGRSALVDSIAALAAAFLEQARLRRDLSTVAAEHETDTLRSAFVSSVSHELKSPLASAKAAVTGLLLDGARVDDARVRVELEAAESDLLRLEQSIGDLLDASRLESQSWRGRPEAFEIGEIIGAVLDGLNDEQRRRITLAVPPDLPEVRVDFAMLSRALRNVVGNALLYAPEGAVQISASADGGWMLLSVSDEGPGIAEGERELVFDKFYRGETAATVTMGTGLGLHIAREVALMHGGRIEAERVEPHGARIVMRLPLEGR